MDNFKTHVARFEEMPEEGGFLSAAEQKYYDSLKSAKRRADYALGRWAAKNLLSRHFLPLPLKEIEIVKREDGSPAVTAGGEEKEIYLSISHSNGVAVAAASATGKIGVDIEKTEERSGAWARFSFRPEEMADSTPEFMTELWTKKEAALKVLGVGLSASLHEMSFEKGKIVLYGKLKEKFDGILEHLRVEKIDLGVDGFIVTVSFLTEEP